jgi:hypothetical protein
MSRPAAESRSDKTFAPAAGRDPLLRRLPNHESALALIERVDRELGPNAEVRLVNVRDQTFRSGGANNVGAVGRKSAHACARAERRACHDPVAGMPISIPVAIEAGRAIFGDVLEEC